jgi:hypothetical protein
VFTAAAVTGNRDLLAKGKGPMTLTHPRRAAAPAAGAGLTARARSLRRAAAARLARPGKTARAIAAGMPVRPGERVLTLDHTSGGSMIAATAAAVYIGRSEPGCPWCRIGWEQVTRAGWDGRRCVLAITGVGPDGAWRKELALDRRRPLVDLARERVNATLLASATVRDGDQVCAVVMARRQPGSGTVIWVTLVNGAWCADDRQKILARAAAAIAGLRAQTGIPSR